MDRCRVLGVVRVPHRLHDRLPFLVAGVALFIRLSSRPDTAWPADLGLLAGAGFACLLIAGINLASGDLSPTVWASVGLALTASATFAFWWLRCRPVRM